MGDMDKSEKFTVAGYLFIPIGMFMFADADVVMRCYGDERAASKRSSPAVASSASAAGPNGRTGDGDTVGHPRGCPLACGSYR